MCTVTIIPKAEGIRIAVNRDESNARRAATPPEIRGFGGPLALMPVDPESNGSWVAVSETGLALVLLNRNERLDLRGSDPVRSRGEIIPALLHCESIEECEEELFDVIDPGEFLPFRLLIMKDRILSEISSDGRELRRFGARSIEFPIMFTSSGLGDAFVERFRRELFNDMFYAGIRDTIESARVWIALQDEYHRHHWPLLPHLSVRMKREDARTVSTTVLDLTRERALMSYVADPGDSPAVTGEAREVVTRLAHAAAA